MRIKVSRRMKIRSRPLSPRSRPAKGERKKKRNEEIDPERRREITGEHYRDAARFHEFREIFISNSRPDARISIIYTLLVIPSGIRFGYPSLSLARAGKNNSWIVSRLHKCWIIVYNYSICPILNLDDDFSSICLLEIEIF